MVTLPLEKTTDVILALIKDWSKIGGIKWTANNTFFKWKAQTWEMWYVKNSVVGIKTMRFM